MTRYVVIGGGVAGVACAEELCRVSQNGDSVHLVSASATIKGIKNYVKLTDALEKFDVEERSLDALQSAFPGRLFVRQAVVATVDAASKAVVMNDGSRLDFDKLCVGTGASPRLVLQHPLVVGLRDTQSAQDLARHLATARRVVLLGNGGIALGLVHALRPATSADGAGSGRAPLQVVWAVRDSYAGSPFFDASASEFFLSHPAPAQEDEGGERDGEGQGQGQGQGGETEASGGAGIRVMPSMPSSAGAAGSVRGMPRQGGDTNINSSSSNKSISSTSPDAAAGATVGLLVDDAEALRLAAVAGLDRADGEYTRPGHGAHSTTMHAGVEGRDGNRGEGNGQGRGQSREAAAEHSGPGRPAGGEGAELAPLPPRETAVHRRKRARVDAGPSGPSSATASGTAGGGSTTTGSTTICSTTTASGSTTGGGVVAGESETSQAVTRNAQAARLPQHSSTSVSPDATAPVIPVMGSSLGPTWMTVLQQVGVAGGRGEVGRGVGVGDAAGDTGDGAPEPMQVHVHSNLDSASSGDTPPWTAGGVLLETNVEAVAIRGAGATGAVGPLADGQWHALSGSGKAGGAAQTRAVIPEPLHEEYPAQDAQAVAGGAPWPLHLRLSNGRVYGCDLIVSATGVVPCTCMLPLPGQHGGALGAEVSPPNSAQAAAYAPLLPPAVDSLERLRGSHAFLRGPDGGLIVNKAMQTTGSADIYAAGDCASMLWPRTRPLHANAEAGYGDPVSDPRAHPALWFQMRLWTQARVAGAFAARCMAGAADPLEADDGGVPYELFAHASTFLGRKVVLLGAFNGQGLGLSYERALRTQVATAAGLRCAGAGAQVSQTGGAMPATAASNAAEGQAAGAAQGDVQLISSSSPVQVQVRVTPGLEYAKLVLLHGRVVGALLVGEAAEDLAETMENLILNRTDVRVRGRGRRKGRAQGKGASGVEEDDDGMGVDHGRAGAGHVGGQGQEGRMDEGVEEDEEEEEEGELETLDLLNPDVDVEDYFD